MVQARLNPTLFEKLTLSDRVTTVLDEGRTEMQDVNAKARDATITSLDRYTESALRASVRRELSWLLNTVRLEATQDLTRTPQVTTSVLNYGMSDLTGRASTKGAVQTRAREMEAVIRTFEPRLDPAKLRVEFHSKVNDDNAVSYVIHGDVTAAVNALPVLFVAAVEVETGETVVQD